MDDEDGDPARGASGRGVNLVTGRRQSVDLRTPPASVSLISRTTGLLKRSLAVVFAGERLVWLSALGVGIPFLGLLVAWCVIPRAYYVGTDSVDSATLSAPIGRNVRACMRGLDIPAGTRRVQIGLSSGHLYFPSVQVQVNTPQGHTTSTVGVHSYGRATPVFASVPRIPAGVSSVPASVCVRSRQGSFAVGGDDTTEATTSFTIAGKPTLTQAAVWYLPATGARRSYLGEFATMARRAAVLAPGYVAPWLYWVVFFGVLPLIALLAIRLLAVAVAGGTSVRRLALWVFLIAALNGMSWSVITPTFQSPDEVDHYAYTESLVERGLKPDPYPTPILRWSASENDAILATNMLVNHNVDDSRSPGLPVDVTRYARLKRRMPPHRDDGGGNQTTSSYGPLYYYAIAPGYLLGGTPFSRMGAMRLISALIGALAGVFTLLLMLELTPRRRWLAVIAAFAVTFEPMYSFLSGAVNNDIGIDAGAAAVAYLLVRLVRRGLPGPLVLVLGLLLGALPWVKSSAYELWVLAIVAVVLAAWTGRDRLRTLVRERDLPRPLAFLTGAIVLFLLAYLGARHLNTVLTPKPFAHGQASIAVTSSTGAATGTVSVITDHLGSYLSYLYQVFLPDFRGMTRHFPKGSPSYVIFMQRGWAAFGWYDTFFPGWIYWALQIGMGVALLLGLWGLWLRRRLLRVWWPTLLLLVLIPIVVFAGFEAAFYTPYSRQIIAEMGRYEFPALAALAALGVGSLLGVARRIRLQVGTGLLVALLALCYASQALVFVTFFS